MTAKRHRAAAAVVVLGLALALAGPAAGKPDPAKAAPVKPEQGHIKVYQEGVAFCPAAALVAGSVVVSAGRCYAVLLMRSSGGAYLVFASPGTHVPPGQVVRLSTPAGAKLKGRIFYTVPVQAAAVAIPADTIVPVVFRVEEAGPRLTLTITNQPAPNLAVSFQVRV